MLKKELPPITYLQFEKLPHLQHAVVTRHGGVSPQPFDSLNIGDNVPDAPENVQANLALLKKTFNLKSIIMGEQVHSDQIQLVDHTTPSLVPGCDALITQTKNIALLIKHADCQATILYDPKQHALGLVHAGWKGNVKRIYTKTIHAMQQHFGSRPSDLIVCISPSLGPDHAEFINYKKEFPPSFHPYQTIPFYFNLWSIAHDELTQSGIDPENIEIASICTYCNQDFFSYRRDHITGRNATFAQLN